MPESKTASMPMQYMYVMTEIWKSALFLKKNHHCIRNPSTKCWYARTLYEYIYCEVFKNSGPKMAGLNKWGSTINPQTGENDVA